MAPPLQVATSSPSGVRTLPAAATTTVRDRLTGPVRAARVVHRGRGAVYVEADGWALGVVGPGATRVPCALALAEEVDLGAVEHAEIGAGSLVLHGPRRQLTVRVGRVVDVTVPRLLPPAPAVVARLLAHARVASDELGPDLVAAVPGAPERLLGLGSGLTPLGDDVLAGWAATSYALGAPVDDLHPRRRTTLLSATLLDCARRGEVLPEFRDLVAVLGDADLAEACARRLAGVGHTSGAGLLLGACLRLRVVEPFDALPRPSPAAQDEQ